jgi:hypothetical protein
VPVKPVGPKVLDDKERGGAFTQDNPRFILGKTEFTLERALEIIQGI